MDCLSGTLLRELGRSQFPVVSFQLSLQSGDKKITRSQVRVVRKLGHQGGLALGQEVGVDEGIVARALS